MCGVCSPRHYRTAAMSCEQCGATSQLTLVLGMLLAVSIVGVAIHMGQRGASKPSSMTSVLQKIYFNTAQVQRSKHSRDKHFLSFRMHTRLRRCICLYSPIATVRPTTATLFLFVVCPPTLFHLIAVTAGVVRRSILEHPMA